MEEYREIKTFKVDYKCPKCGEGYLRPTGEALTSMPLQYPHECTHCIYKEVFKKTYPYIETEYLSPDTYHSVNT